MVSPQCRHCLSRLSLLELAADGFYCTVSTLNNANQYDCNCYILVHPLPVAISIERELLTSLEQVNTSATNNANWTQLTSTNIDASNIVAGTIDPVIRLASTEALQTPPRSLRGDSSWELCGTVNQTIYLRCTCNVCFGNRYKLH